MKNCVIIAPNDRYNYGDLLFTYVLRARIGAYYDRIFDIATIDIDLTQFGGHKVHSIKNINKITGNICFDVILAGGHSLFCPWPFVLYCLDNKYAWLSKFHILLSKIFSYKNSKKIINYLSRKVFGAKTRYPYSIGKYEIKGSRFIIYNSVDGNLEPDLDIEDKNILNSIDYLAVRNKKTYFQLKDNGLNVFTFPDSAIQISRIFPIQTLSERISIKQDYFKSPYIVFQINRGLGEKFFLEITRNLERIINNYNYKIYLCPIGFAKGHEDLIILKKIFEYIGKDNLILFNNLNIWDIMGLIANSKGFIGSSLHGCITAMSYCKPYLGLEVPKTVNYINDWGLGNDYCADCYNFYSKFQNMINCTPETLEKNLVYQMNKSDESFRNIQNIIAN
ncbi:MAG: polysaccharide pyruvyl transferase family protein [Muribaculaceae bacterium]